MKMLCLVCKKRRTDDLVCSVCTERATTRAFEKAADYVFKNIDFAKAIFESLQNEERTDQAREVTREVAKYRIEMALAFFGFPELPSLEALDGTFRRYAKVVHPDAGGFPALMAFAVECRELLRKRIDITKESNR